MRLRPYILRTFEVFYRSLTHECDVTIQSNQCCHISNMYIYIYSARLQAIYIYIYGIQGIKPEACACSEVQLIAGYAHMGIVQLAEER